MANRLVPGELFPALDDYIAVHRVNLQSDTNPARGFGRDDRRAATEKWIVDHLAGKGVIEDRPAHAFFARCSLTTRPGADWKSAMRCVRMRSPLVEAVDNFHWRRMKGRKASRIQSSTIQTR